MAEPVTAAPRRNPTAGMGRILLVVAAAFVVTFSLVPLYRIACEKVFGIRLEQGPADARAATLASATKERWITVQFDGGVNSKLPWDFAPDQREMRVQPGKQYQASYTARNTSKQVVVGNAVPSVAPAKGSKYFQKTECFCFTEQKLDPGQSRDMPVRFIVDPALPAEINTLTLSYTFYQNDTQTARAREAAGAGAATAAPAAP